jgi:DNA-binding transcriptional MerR regulator
MQLDLLGNELALPQDAAPPTAKKPTPKTAAVKTVPEPAQATPAIDIIGDEDKAPNAFRTISEVASSLNVPQHVLRFWESRFSQIKPLKLRGGRRYYRPEDVETLTTIKHLLYKQGYTIKGAKKAFGQLTGRGKDMTVALPDKTALSKPVNVKTMLNDRQQSQLAVIRQEMLSLHDILKPFMV